MSALTRNRNVERNEAIARLNRQIRSAACYASNPAVTRSARKALATLTRLLPLKERARARYLRDFGSDTGEEPLWLHQEGTNVHMVLIDGPIITYRWDRDHLTRVRKPLPPDEHERLYHLRWKH